MFLLYRCARCFAPLHRGTSVASASRSAKRRSGVGTFSPNRTSWRALRSFIPEGAETGDGVADDERIHLACTDDFDLCLEATGEAEPKSVRGAACIGHGLQFD